jgi:hypothetical protein
MNVTPITTGPISVDADGNVTIAWTPQRELTTIHLWSESADTMSPKIIISHGNGKRSGQIIVTDDIRFPAVPIASGTIQYRQEAY